MLHILSIMTGDLFKKSSVAGKTSTEITVADIMSSDFPRITPHDSVDYCMQLMSDRNIRYLPVLKASTYGDYCLSMMVVRETRPSRKPLPIERSAFQFMNCLKKSRGRSKLNGLFDCTFLLPSTTQRPVQPDNRSFYWSVVIQLPTRGLCNHFQVVR